MQTTGSIASIGAHETGGGETTQRVDRGLVEIMSGNNAIRRQDERRDVHSLSRQRIAA
jgi:hypothetical protein